MRLHMSQVDECSSSPTLRQPRFGSSERQFRAEIATVLSAPTIRHSCYVGTEPSSTRFPIATRDAREFVERIGKRIVLIDGPRLAELMIDFGIGVTEVASYSVRRLDTDYFEGDAR